MTPPEKVRVALYVRVSTEEQAQSGFSINGQLEKLDMACKLHNWEPLPAYVDEGFSGKNLDRPQMKKLIRDARAKRFDVLVVYKLDRISRRLSDLISLRDEFELLGVGIRSATEPFDTTNSAGKLLFNMLGSFAQFEREIIIDRTKMGMKRRLKEGKWNSTAPFGYRLKKDGTLEIHPDELAMARKVFDYFLNDNMGAKTIARRLRQEDHSTRRKNAWAKNSVWNMLRNPVYAGFYRIDEELTKAPHKGIISPEEFHQIQQMLAGKTPANARLQMSPNFLLGLIKCGKCGSGMTVGKGKQHHYYVCSGRVGDRGCQMPWVRSKPVEKSILDEIKTVAGMPQVIDESISELKSKNETGGHTLRSEKTALEKQLQNLEKTKESKIRWMLEMTPDASLALEVQKEVHLQMESMKAIRRRLEEITVQLEALGSDEVATDVIADYLKHFSDIFDGLETGQKRLLIQGLVKEVVIHKKDDCSLTLTIPLPKKPHTFHEMKKDPSLDENDPFLASKNPPLGADSVHRSTLNGVAS